MIRKLKHTQYRTESKLLYARIHLDELKNNTEKWRASNFSRAHIESFIFHLFGARDALLQEMNIYYDCKLDIKNVTDEKLEKHFKKSRIQCHELQELVTLERDNGSWLYIAKDMRNHITHRDCVTFGFFAGGKEDRQVHLHRPKSQASLDEDYLETFEKWYNNMCQLIDTLRGHRGCK